MRGCGNISRNGSFGRISSNSIAVEYPALVLRVRSVGAVAMPAPVVVWLPSKPVVSVRLLASGVVVKEYQRASLE